MFKRGKWGKSVKINTLIGAGTEITGDIQFQGGLHVEGVIRGNVIADNHSDSILIVSEAGKIEGEVDVPRVVLNGTVVGNVRATDQIELAANARVSGNVYYNLIEMAMGAEVNGSLVHNDVSSNSLSENENTSEFGQVEPAGNT